MSTPTVIAGWGALNGVLVAVLLGYARAPFPLALYGSAVLLLEIVALAAWLTQRDDRGRVPVSPAPGRSRASLLAALVAAFIGLGLVYRVYMMIPGVYPLLALVGEGARHVWQRVSPDTADDVPEPEPEPQPAVSAAGAVAVAGAVAAGAAGVRARWWRRRR